MTFAPISCPSCGASADLDTATASRCRYCQADIAIPTTYLEALEAQRRASEACRHLEPTWRDAVAAPWAGFEWLGAALLLLLPPAGAWASTNLSPQPLSQASALVLVALPLCLPGGSMFVWSIVRGATSVDVRDALAAAPPPSAGGPPACRGCGAPLVAAPDAIIAACAYCKTESLVGEAALGRHRAGKLAQLATINEAIAALKSRRFFALLSSLGVAAIVLVIGLSLWVALRAAI